MKLIYIIPNYPYFETSEKVVVVVNPFLLYIFARRSITDTMTMQKCLYILNKKDKIIKRSTVAIDWKKNLRYSKVEIKAQCIVSTSRKLYK